MKTTAPDTKRRGRSHIADVTQPLEQPYPRNATLGRTSAKSASLKRFKTSSCERKGFHKILVPVDFSKESQNAVQYAVELALRFHASIFFLHAVETVDCSVDCGYGPMIHHIPNKDLARKAKARLRLLTKKLHCVSCCSADPILAEQHS